MGLGCVQNIDFRQLHFKKFESRDVTKLARHLREAGGLEQVRLSVEYEEFKNSGYLLGVPSDKNCSIARFGKLPYCAGSEVLIRLKPLPVSPRYQTNFVVSLLLNVSNPCSNLLGSLLNLFNFFTRG